MSQPIQGIAIYEGLALAPINKVYSHQIQIAEDLCLDVLTEKARFETAVNQSKQQIQSLIEAKKSILGPEEIQIFEAHLMFLEDPEYLSQINDKIQNQKWDATKAVDVISKEFSQMLAALPDPYLSARSQDIRDIGQRLLRNLSFKSLGENSPQSPLLGILALKEIHPSLVAELNPLYVKGVLTEEGGSTSHAAILLKNLEIPSIFGLPHLLQKIENGDVVLMDARNGMLFLNPSAEEKTWFQNQELEFQKEKALWNSLKTKAAETQDGFRIHLHANVGALSDLPSLEKYNPDGIGLFRTEFLFLDRNAPPSEEEQFQIYSKILQTMKGKKTILRTLDIGGDKIIPYLNLPQEENPFLGLRGLRLCLVHQDLFRTQIRALLRASVHGALSIMYPMVTQKSEWEQAQAIVQEELKTLHSKNVPIASTPRFGIMIEVPATALMIESYIPDVDFFSIGTNDLIQYTCACDRLNPSVRTLYSHYEPAVLKLIHQLAQTTQHHQKDLSLCGEMGGDLELIPFLIGCGLTHLSMSPSQIPKVKLRLQTLTREKCQHLAAQILKAPSAIDVKSILQNFISHL